MEALRLEQIYGTQRGIKCQNLRTKYFDFTEVGRSNLHPVDDIYSVYTRHEKTVDESRRFFQRSLPLRASEAADAVKLLRSEVCFTSVLRQTLLHFVPWHNTSRLHLAKPCFTQLTISSRNHGSNLLS